MKTKSNFFVIVSIITLLLAASCGKKPSKPVALNQLDENGMRQGEWHIKYPDGKLREIIFFKDDKQSGAQKRFFENGQLNIEMYWACDSLSSWLDSVNRMYGDDGTLLLESFYKDGIPDSLFRIFYNNGILKQTERYRQGQKVGLWQYFREDGTLEKTIDYTGFEQNWSEENQSGIITWYDETGKAVKSEIWTQGSQIEIKNF